MTRIFRHTLAAWIALFALLFGALAPTLSHAFVRAAPQAVEFPICSAGGHTPELKSAGLPDLGVDPSKHCPYCADQHHAPGLLPHNAAAILAVGGFVRPFLFYAAPAPLFQWSTPQSRAPPRLS
ncbi:DUF2946 domain-containing protein [Massilia sp. Leaf139]|uniref:DUF2946 domain-containing protein n=1 Tax=Massilia sp. Leaf139 TaxID=1736272 RepID=UPI0006FAEF3B|nr:DUF2946 domain-containing protein [Massilia sp. Leaf139]KQQ94961.1 hypothetical protein ASF77_22180 [Massilia sp. Leaf139]